MNFEVFTTLVVSIILAFAGWLVAHYLSLRQNRLEKQREYKTSFLVGSYRDLVELANDGINSFDDFKKLRAATTDIYLFGNSEQQKILNGIKTRDDGTIDLGHLIGNLKNQLRKDLGLPLLKEQGDYFGIIYNVPAISKLGMQSEGSKYLSSAYKTLLKDFGNGVSQTGDFERLYEILLDIWLYGTEELGEIATEIAHDPSNKNVKRLIRKLHQKLRSDWGLESSMNFGVNFSIVNGKEDIENQGKKGLLNDVKGTESIGIEK